MSAAQETFDYVVVGGSPSGCAAAARIAEADPGASVVLIEAGPRKANIFSDIPLGIAALVGFKGRHNYAFKTEKQPGLNNRRGYQPRGRGVGGSSLINAMIYIRGQKEDYDDWEAAGATGWSWSEVLPYFVRSENNERGPDNLHGASGPLHISDLRSPSPASAAFLAACAERGLKANPDFNGAEQEGVGLYQVFQKDGMRFSAGRAYVETLSPRNLAVRTDVPVERVLIENNRAVGVRFADGREIRARREVLLSAGAFGTPQILMLSGIGPGAHLRSLGIDVVHDSPEVGQNLQDHLDATISRIVPGRKDLLGVTPGMLPQILRGWSELKRHGRGLLTSNVAEAGGFLKTDPDADRPDVQLHFCIGIVDDHNRKLHMTRGMSLHVCVLRPKSRGFVALRSRDVRKPLVIDPKFLSRGEDLETLVKGARMAQDILSAPAMTRYAGRPLYDAETRDENKLRAFIRAHADTIYHPVGTCRMGRDERAPLDPELRVRGVENLRVADASVMPTLVSGNTTAVSAMIGERAASLIARAA